MKPLPIYLEAPLRLAGNVPNKWRSPLRIRFPHPAGYRQPFRLEQQGDDHVMVPDPSQLQTNVRLLAEALPAPKPQRLCLAASQPGAPTAQLLESMVQQPERLHVLFRARLRELPQLSAALGRELKPAARGLLEVESSDARRRVLDLLYTPAWRTACLLADLSPAAVEALSPPPSDGPIYHGLIQRYDMELSEMIGLLSGCRWLLCASQEPETPVTFHLFSRQDLLADLRATAPDGVRLNIQSE